MIRVTEEPIDLAAAVAAVSHPGAGAVVTFIGVVREQSAGRIVDYLEYEAYLPMAERELSKIAAEAGSRWGARVAILHRIGRLAVGEASVAIAVATPHRAEAFHACRFVIDTLKESVPIWKREHGPDGSTWVEHPVESASCGG